MATTAPLPPQAPAPASSTTTTTPANTADDFDSLLTLEDQFYNQGYNQGMADGLAAGRAEGRQLGLERGFQKFVESGRLQGRAIVWANRLRLARARTEGVVTAADSGGSTAGGSGPSSLGEGLVKGDEVGRAVGGDESGREVRELPPLPDNPRLGKHITTLYALVEMESLSTENNDEAVDDFDDRLRRAQGRFKVIERMVGEGENGKQKGGDSNGHDPGAGSGKGEAVDV